MNIKLAGAKKPKMRHKKAAHRLMLRISKTNCIFRTGVIDDQLVDMGRELYGVCYDSKSLTVSRKSIKSVVRLYREMLPVLLKWRSMKVEEWLTIFTHAN